MGLLFFFLGGGGVREGLFLLVFGFLSFLSLLICYQISQVSSAVILFFIIFFLRGKKRIKVMVWFFFSLLSLPSHLPTCLLWSLEKWSSSHHKLVSCWGNWHIRVTESCIFMRNSHVRVTESCVFMRNSHIRVTEILYFHEKLIEKGYRILYFLALDCN